MNEADKGAAYNAKQREAAKRIEITRKTVIRGLMSQPDGRRYIWLELSECHCFTQSFAPGHADVTAFNEGQRSRGLKLLDDVTRWAPEQYILMTKENSSVQLKEEPEDDG